MDALRKAVLGNLPAGFTEEMSYGMAGYVVPHSLYPAGYHCDPKLPLPMINLASQKSGVALHHLGLYASPALTDWFVSEYARRVPGKLDMGKGCVRFKKELPGLVELIAELAAKITPEEWIALYEASFKKQKK